MKKRVVGFLLLAALTFVLTSCANPPEAPAGKFSYDVLNDGTAVITEYSGTETVVTIPAELDGYAVTRIGTYALDYCQFEKVIIPEGVVSIGDSAFCACRKLTEVVLPTTLVSIGKLAFADCEVLTAIDIPLGVRSIGNAAFHSCTQLRDVTIPASVTDIGEGAFRKCTSLREITIPGSVAAIGNTAFYECHGMTAVTICDGVGTIGHNAFYGCRGLRTVTIPGSVAVIGDSAFFDCRNLGCVTIGGGVTTIGSGAFRDCDLKSIHIPDSVTAMDDFSFYDDVTIIFDSQSSYTAQFCREEGLTALCAYDTVMLEDGTIGIVSCNVEDQVLSIPAELDGCRVTAIGPNAFSGCENLVSVTIPDSVLWITGNPFAGCGLLSEINVSYLHPTLAVMDGALYSMADRRLIGLPAGSSATEYAIPQGVQSVGDDAFANCTNLIRVTIPESVIGIGSGAFSGCYRLENVDVGGNAIAAQYCNEYDLPCTYAPSYDWLSD